MEGFDLDRVMALEREMQTGVCRRNPGRMRALLADDFEEVGASGQVWNRESTLELVRSDCADDPEIDVLNIAARVIRDDVVMIRWDSNQGRRRARRTSLWRRDPAGWRLVHHQGTLIAD
jgi:ribonuclease HI